MQIVYSTNFVGVFVLLTSLHNYFLWPLRCWWDPMTSKTRRAILWHVLWLGFIPHSLSLSCSRSTSLFHSDAEEAASYASLWVLHNDDFECGMLKCFHAAFQNARESVPVQAQTKDVDHTVTGVVKSPLFTSSRKQPETRPAELRWECQEKSAGRKSEQLSYLRVNIVRLIFNLRHLTSLTSSPFV